MEESKPAKRLPPSLIFWLVVSIALIAARLAASQILQSSAWHIQNRHRLQICSYDFLLPRSWYPDYGGIIRVSLERASFFDIHSQGAYIEVYAPEAMPDPEAFEAKRESIESSSNMPWVKAPILHLRGKPGRCIVHDLKGRTSGSCMFYDEGLIVWLYALDKRGMQEVASFFDSATPHPGRAYCFR